MRGRDEQQDAHADGRDAVESEAVHAEGRDEEDGEEWPKAEAAVAANAEDAHALATRALRDAVDAAGGLRMEDGRRDAHDRNGGEDQPVVGEEARQSQRGAGKEDADGHEPLARALVGQIAEQGLDDGGGEHQARDGRVVHAVEADEERQQGGQRTRVDVIAQMRRSEQIEVFLVQRIKSFHESIFLLYHTSCQMLASHSCLTERYISGGVEKCVLGTIEKCVLGTTCGSF